MRLFAKTSTATPEAQVDDLAPVNRFSVTILVGHPKPERRKVELLRRAEYDRCSSVEAEVVREHGQVVAVIGYSFLSYEIARAIAQLHLRKLQAQVA